MATSFLRILPPVGRQRTIWALHSPRCFILPIHVFLFGRLATSKKQNQFNLSLAYSLANFTIFIILSLKYFLYSFNLFVIFYLFSPSPSPLWNGKIGEMKV